MPLQQRLAVLCIFQHSVAASRAAESASVWSVLSALQSQVDDVLVTLITEEIVEAEVVTKCLAPALGVVVETPASVTEYVATASCPVVRYVRSAPLGQNRSHSSSGHTSLPRPPPTETCCQLQGNRSRDHHVHLALLVTCAARAPVTESVLHAPVVPCETPALVTEYDAPAPAVTFTGLLL